MLPPELATNDDKIEFISPPKLAINAANRIPEEDLVSYKLEDVNRGEIRPREFLVSNAVITASAHLSVKDEFYQPPRTPQKQGMYTFIFLHNQTKICRSFTTLNTRIMFYNQHL